MGKIYAGVSNTAREVKAIYAGVGGVAKAVKKVYAGVNNVAKLIWPTSGAVLPVEYQQVLYIQSSGTQYINTGTDFGYNATDYSEVYLKMQWTAISTEAIPFGLRTGSGNTYMCFGYASTGSNWYLGTGAVSYSSGSAPVTGVDYELQGYFEKNNQWLKINGVTEITRTDNTNRLATRNAWLFGSNAQQGGQYRRLASMQLYHAKIWRNGDLVRDFYPCYRKADNVAGLYDITNDVFYTNSGSGTFAVGSDHEGPL